MDKKFSKSIGVFVICLITVVGLRISYPSGIDDPPYWDAPMGPLYEAVWLARHDFNYQELSQQRGFSGGGPNVYFFSAYPTLQALAMRAFHQPAAWIKFSHSVVYILAGLTLGGVFLIARKYLSSRLAVALCCALGLQPLFQSQAHAINMEMPMTCLTVWGLYYYLKNKEGLGMLLLLLAFAIKFSAALPAMGLGVSYLLFRAKGWKSIPVLVAAFVPFILLSVFQWIGGRYFTDYGNVGLRIETLYNPADLLKMFKRSITLAGDTYLLLVAFILLGCVVALWGVLRELKKKDSSGCFTRLRELGMRNESWLCCLITCGGMFLMVTLQEILLPRYLLIVLPFIYLGSSVLTFHLFPRVILPGLVLLCALHVVNHDGRVLRLLSSAHVHNNGDILERSMEYREDLVANELAAEWLQENIGDRRLVTSWPYVHMYRLPELGYVDKPLKMASSWRPALVWDGVEEIHLMVHLGDYSPETYLWLASDSAFFRKLKYKPDTDRLLHEVKSGDRRLYIFERPLIKGTVYPR